ncbi:acyltransferase family protein [Lysobacter olei]
MTRTIGIAWDSGTNQFHLIRLIAAWLVIYSHAWPITGAPGSDLLGQLTGMRTAGALAVDVFFVISGFLVAASLSRHTVRDFVLARALRIYPALIVCVALTVFLMAPLLTTAPKYWGDHTTWRYLLSNITLWRAEFWLPGVFEALPRTAINGSLWTLPIEARLYVCLLVAGLLGMLTPRRYLPAWALALGGAAAYAWRSAPLPEHLIYLLWVTSFFITGTLLWVMRSRVRLHGGAVVVLLALTAVTRGSVAFIPTYFVLVAYGTFWLAFLGQRAIIRRTDLSYGLYLYGWPAQQLAFMAGATGVASNIFLATMIALACAGASWRWIEAPALALKRRSPSTSAPLPATDTPL